MPHARRIDAAAAVLTLASVALSLPPLRTLIEQSMVWHMLVQMPLLMAAGWLGAAALAARCPPGLRVAAARLNRYGLSGFMLAQVVLAYWMIPAAIDRAVVLPAADAAKILTLWAAGAALRASFAQAPAAVQLFFAGYSLPMAVWLGLYLAGTDLRLCNAYSMESQIAAGRGLVALSVATGAAWLLALRSAATRGADADGEIQADAAGAAPRVHTGAPRTTEHRP